MGDGAFLDALREEAHRRRLDAQLWGIELAADTFAATVARGAIDAKRAIRDDFLVVAPFEVDAVVGNPPYVRLRNLPTQSMETAKRSALKVLGHDMDPSGSVWMPFVLHATQFLARGGRLAFVLPFDLTYVRYARELWEFLGETFGSLRVCRVRERMFPEILQEVVLFFADNYGSTSDHVTFESYQTLAQLDCERPDTQSPIPLDAIVSGQRPFLRALLPSSVNELLTHRIAPLTDTARDIVTFNIGYVCGDKLFFHPNKSTIEAFALAATSVIPSLTSSRQLRNCGLRTTTVEAQQFDQLFLPIATDDDTLGEGEREYIQHGVREKVDQRYKCRVREPWFVTPGVKIPDVVVPVFSERPTLVINDANVVASNSLLCGYLRSGSAPILATRWYTSLTLLQFELEVHSLGGGVMVMVPREAGRVRLARIEQPLGTAHLNRIHRHLVTGRTAAAFELGDLPVLSAALGLTSAEIETLQAATHELSRWRTASRLPTA